jgi:hypothetical protein
VIPRIVAIDGYKFEAKASNWLHVASPDGVRHIIVKRRKQS